jgi:hypothetical protein
MTWEKVLRGVGRKYNKLWFFRSAVPRNNIFKMFIFLFLYPLHVSALLGHPQVVIEKGVLKMYLKMWS